jgi:hypothetical protein
MDAYPFPLIDDVFSQLVKYVILKPLDLQFGFCQICMVPKDVWKTAVITKKGLFEWKVMSFSLKNAIGAFSRMMNEVFSISMNGCVKMSVDDVNVRNQV